MRSHFLIPIPGENYEKANINLNDGRCVVLFVFHK